MKPNALKCQVIVTNCSTITITVIKSQIPLCPNSQRLLFSQIEVLRFETTEEHRDGHMGLVKVALQGEIPNGMGERQMAQSLAESGNLEWHSHSLWKPLSRSVQLSCSESSHLSWFSSAICIISDQLAHSIE